MLLLVAQQIDRETEYLGLDERTIYRPDLERKNPAALARALVVLRPNILIGREHPHFSVAAAWRKAMPQKTLVSIVSHPGFHGDSEARILRPRERRTSANASQKEIPRRVARARRPSRA